MTAIPAKVQARQARTRPAPIILAGTAVLAAAFIVRLYGLDFGLPFATHPDEARYLHAGIGILQTGDLNPGWFHQPSLYTYLITTLLALYARLLALPTTALFRPPYHFDGLIAQPDLFLVARLVTALLGVATVALVLRLGRHWFGWAGALFAAALLAVSALHVSASHFIATDVPVAFFILITIALASRLGTTGAPRDYWLAGAFAGLAVGTKYSAYVVSLPLALAHLYAWRAGRAPLIGTRLLALAAAGIAAFLLTTPYALLDSTQFLHDVRLEWTHHRVTGHIGAEGESARWLLARLLNSPDRWLTLTGLAGFAIALWQRHRPLLLTLTFVVAYFISMSLNIVRFERFLIPLLPPLALAAGYALAKIRLRLPENIARTAVPLIALLLLAEPALGTWQVDRALAGSDTRDVARRWLADNVPPGARIAVETYAPDLDATDYDAVYFSRLNENPPDYYREQGFDYLIFAEARYGPVFRDPERYPDLIAAYEALFGEFELVVTLDGTYVDRPSSQIQVYRP